MSRANDSDVILIATVGQMGNAAKVGLESQLGPLVGTLLGFPALLVQHFGKDASVSVFSMPDSILDRVRIMDATGWLHEGLSVSIGLYDRANFEWQGDNLDAIAGRFGIDLASTPAPDLPDQWMAHLVERGDRREGR